MSMKEKDGIKKQRRWRFSKKKMKESAVSRILPHDLKELLEREEINLKPRVGFTKSSSLSPSLMDILKKSVALGYFLEYLQERDKKPLVDFWLEAETLHLVSETNHLRQTCSNSRRYSRSASMSNSLQSLAKSGSAKQECPPSKTSPDSSKKNNNSLNSLDSACFCPDSVDTSENKFDDVSVELNTSTVCQLNDRDQVKTNNLDAIHPTNHEWDSTYVEKNSRASSSSPCSDKSDDKRKSPTLRTYNEFKQRAKARAVIVDAVSIYSKYISLNADFPIDLPSSERQIIEATICRDENNLDPNCFVAAQEFAFEQLEGIYDVFLSTTYIMAYQSKFIHEKELRIQDVLYDEGILFYFLEFLDLQKAKTAYEFYITAESFEEDVEVNQKESTYDKESTINDAMHIYERYFSMKCKEQLISDDKLRIVLENNICREDGPQSNCFCIPMAYAWTALSEVYFPMFMESAAFSSYDQHLQRALQRGEDMKSRCSSARSSLSLEDHQAPLVQKYQQHVTVKSIEEQYPLMKSESKLNLFDDNSLEDFWFKPRQPDKSLSASRLTLGHINEFGVFCSGMEEQPPDETNQDSSVTKFGKKMKNLLRGETFEETEQLAWDRARKIIGDIQKQTQN